MRQENLDVRLENQTLTVKGERKFENEEKEENFHRIERRYGSFVRSFSIPVTVDTANLQAKYEHGVLALTLPKKEVVKPKQIKVEIGSGAEQGSKQVEGSQAA